MRVGAGWKRGLAALGVGLALRVLFVWKHPLFVGDTLIYGDLAHNLLAHHVYGFTDDGVVRATLIRLPGYPLFLAMCFALFGTANYMAVLWVQVGVDLLSCWLLGRVAARLFGERAGLVCLWLAALCPFTANYTGAALTETLSIFCVVVAFWAMVRWGGAVRARQPGVWWGLVIGAALSGALLLRPDGILLAGTVIPAMVWSAWRGETRDPHQRDRRHGPAAWRGVVAATGLLAACVGLWTARNWQVYHVIQPLAPKYANDPGEPEPLGFARWYRTWALGYGDTARVYWVYDGSTMDLKDLPPWAFDSRAQRAETVRLYARYNEGTSSTPAIEAAFARLATERVRTHPLRYYVVLPLAKLGDMWLRPRTQLMKAPAAWWNPYTRPRATAFACVYGLINVALLVAAVVGVVRWRRLGWGNDGVSAAAMLGYVVLRSGLLLTIDNSEPRYVLEAFPVVLLLAAFALAGQRLARVEMEPRQIFDPEPEPRIL